MGMGCNICGNEVDFCFEGYKGSNADGTKLMFVLNRADARLLPNHSFYDYFDILYSTQSGKILDKITSRAGYSLDEDIYITNIYKGVFGVENSSVQRGLEFSRDEVVGITGPELSGKDPKILLYQNCLPIFEEQLKEFKPRKIVVFGKKAKDVIKRTYHTELYEGIPIYFAKHPSRIWALRNQDKIHETIDNIVDFLSD